MENWDDKIWADKLNSLQDLPAGYTPNLLAKWEIVEAGLPAGRKRQVTPLWVRWSVAVAVLLAIGLVWVNTGKEKADGLAMKEQALKPVIVFQPKHSVENKQVSTNAHPSQMLQPAYLITSTKAKPAKEIAYQAPPQTTTAPVREDTNRGSTKIASRGSEETVLQNDSLPATVLQADIASTLPEKKAVKKKIYQRDFNDGVLVMDTGFAPSSRQHFSIQLNPFGRKTGDGEAPAHRLQLKQVL